MAEIPIFVMTRNDGELLFDCIKSILENTTHSYHVYIVDNNSTDDNHLNIIEHYNNHDKVTVCRNTNNLWILGLNTHLEKVRKNCISEYFVLTDGDIIFPEVDVSSGQCWLSKLVTYMMTYKCIGKIGLSLSWDLIKNDTFFNEIYSQEKRLYNENKKIDELYISPVDTTAAIYRWDWSISGYKFYPDHIRYLRPELYSCRTSKDFTAIHMGWSLYKNVDDPDIRKLNEKIKCFTIIGADIKNTQLAIASKKIRIFNKILARPMKYFWSIRRVFLTLVYTIKKGIWYYDNH